MLELQKNTVKAENQLPENEYVRFERSDASGLKVLFLGNSITRHGVNEGLGWLHDHGMAASAKEKDYVHILMRQIGERHPNASFCICQCAEWERNYKDGRSAYHLFESARNFSADIIIVRLIENCSYRELDPKTFKESLLHFLTYLNASGKAKLVMTTGFWKHPGDAVLREIAAENAYPLAELGDLGEMPEMKAIGLFAHTGVANHPGDLGMEMIAKRIFEKLSLFI